MILRKIAGSIRRENWFSVVLEILVVVVGLFIGLQVDDWNEARKDGNRAKIYHQRLLADLKRELELLDKRISYYSAVRVYAENVVSDLSGPRESLGEGFLIEAYQASQIWEYARISDTYDELVSAGAVNLIPDVELRSRLAQYYQETVALMRYWDVDTGYRELIRTHMPVDLQRRIRKQCEELRGGPGTFEVFTPSIHSCALGLDQNAINRALAMMLDTASLGAEKLLVTANYQVADLDLKIGTFNEKRNHALALIKYMEDHE